MCFCYTCASLKQQLVFSILIHMLQEGKGEQNVEALRNAVVELAKLRQMVESDDAALQVCVFAAPDQQ